ncbi:MAG TPA: hypothetical protein PLQ81_13305, partial [bacterium]|nr:hypothetical protein [bacterium]
MKRLTIIILVYLCLYGIAESADYGIPVNFAGSVSDSVYSNFYMIDYSQTGGIFTDSASNGYYFVNQGYIPYLDAGFSPNNFFVLGKETFITNRNEVSPETAAFKVLDFDSSPVKYASLEFSIADKPANSTGDSYYFTETNDSGEAYLSFKTGDKTGAYIVKAYYRDAGTKYISYNTDETEIPAKQWRMIGLNKTPVNSSVNSAFSGVIPEYIYRWNPETEEHEFHSKYETVKNVNPGEGYFTVFPENTVLSLNGNYITDTFPINLKKGWFIKPSIFDLN